MVYNIDNAPLALSVKCPDVAENLPRHMTGTVIIECNTVTSSDVEYVVKVTHHLALIMIINIDIRTHNSNANSAIRTSRSSVA